MVYLYPCSSVQLFFLQELQLVLVFTAFEALSVIDHDPILMLMTMVVILYRCNDRLGHWLGHEHLAVLSERQALDRVRRLLIIFLLLYLG